MFSALLALGFFPGCAAVGLLVGRNVFPQQETEGSSLVRVAVGFAVGLLLALPIMVVSAACGIYSPMTIGAMGWGITGWAIHRRHLISLTFDRSDIILLVVVTLVGVWHGALRNESLFAGRDQGVYSNHAVHLAKTGDLRADPPYSKLYDEGNYTLALALQAGGYFYDQEARNVYFQFPPSFALYLAQAYGSGGYHGLFLLNPLLGGLNLILFFALARCWLGARWAIFATAWFALNLPQIWISRITLSELVTQTWLLAGILCLHHGLVRPRQITWLAGNLLIAACTLVRIDAFLLVLAQGCIAIWFAWHPATQPLRTAARVGGLLAVGVGMIALGYGFATSPGYYADFGGRLAAMLGGAAVTALLSWWSPPIKGIERLVAILARPWFGHLVATLLFAVVAYAYFLRPCIEPFAEFVASMGQEGRDYRENSVRDIAAYLSPVGLVLTTLGLAVAISRTLTQRETIPIHVPLLALWFSCALLYFYNPYISVDHIWKMRRFVPIIIPGMILVGTLGLARLLGWLPWIGLRRGTAVVAGLAIGLHLWWAGTPLAFTALNRGAVDFIQSISRHLPDNVLLVSELKKPLLGPLQLAEQIDTIRAAPDDPRHSELVRRAIREAHAAGRDVALISRSPMVANPERDAVRFSLTHLNPVRTTEPPPRTMESRTRTVFVTALDGDGVGYNREDRVVRLGANPVYGVEESGFLGQEYYGGFPFRWTLPEARIQAPWTFPDAPQRALLHVLAAKPGGSQTRVVINGETVWDEAIPSSGGIFDLAIDRVQWDREHVEILVRGEGFRPSEVISDSTDDREMALRLAGIILVFREDPELRRLTFGMGRNFDVTTTGVHPVERIHDRPARWTGRLARHEILLPEGAMPQQLTLPVAAVGPDGARMTVRWNGVSLQEIAIPEAPAEVSLRLPTQTEPTNGIVVLEIESSTFVPAKQSPYSTDDRELGVMLHPLTLRW